MTEMKKVSEMKPDEIKEAVRDAYSKVATGDASVDNSRVAFHTV